MKFEIGIFVGVGMEIRKKLFALSHSKRRQKKGWLNQKINTDLKWEISQLKIF